MKSLLIVAFALLSLNALAGDKYICKQIGGDEYSPKKMILTQVSDENMSEGKFYAFKLEIFENNTSKAIVSESVNVRIEDVMVKFTNTAKKISGMIYLDELEASYVKVGSTSYNFDCN